MISDYVPLKPLFVPGHAQEDMSSFGHSTSVKMGIHRNVGGDSSSLGSLKSRRERSPFSTPDRPRKKLKLDPKSPMSQAVADMRDTLTADKLQRMSKLKCRYKDHFLELCFLQDMGNLNDFPSWKKKPPSRVLQAYKSNRLDSDDKDEEIIDVDTPDVSKYTILKINNATLYTRFLCIISRHFF